MQYYINALAEFGRNFQIVWGCINNYGDTGGKMQILKSQLESLISREGDIIVEVEHAESTLGRKRKKEVENWLSNVRRKKDEFSSLDQEVANAGLLSRITSSINLANRMNQLIEEVKELRKQGEFGGGLAQNYIRGYELLTKELVGDTFRQNLRKILSYLMNDDVWRIGVFGMGGVGKTTLITHIYNKLLKAHNTDQKVSLVVVSQKCSPDELQYKIAKCLNLDLSNMDDRINRAGRLSNFLRGKKFVLILDDTWNTYDLKELGLPVDENGCKLILTTRKLDVCNQMECQVSVKVETLLENEAWHLFMKNLGRTKAFPPEVENIARSVAQECGGLPLAIVVVSGSMRGTEDIHEWRNASEALKEANFTEECMEEKVFGVLRISYTRLNDVMAQRCFLHMALYPEDYMIERSELIRYFMDIRLICSRSREVEYDRGHTLVNKLLNVCLLESVKRTNISGQETEELKMHDLLRDMAINMMRSRYMVKAGLHLREIPEEEKWTQNLEVVSLMGNLIEGIPEGMAPKCPRLKFLCLSNNTSLKALPNAFLENMPALQVLDLSWTNIKFLPCSTSNLKNLIALLLRGCRELELVPSVAKMEELRTLDLCESGIRDAPEGLERLVNLRSFDLNGSELRKLPLGVLPKLAHLQYLNLGSKLYAEGREIMSMRNLEDLKCNFTDENEFNLYTAYLNDGKGPKKWDLRLGCVDYDEAHGRL
ncbi:disease resistance protein At4g27190-like [Syzygium oleosum]|uniref:disease resistance protein At4g27190-like n=1 Tax=Syzygium oleosum TaxID=219896 RepID=UPI0024B9F8B3|nr:disease resistance protein At4g27190-like [Syzygium oleosum]